MQTIRHLATLAFAAVICSNVLSAQFDPDDYYVSVPFTTEPGIYQVDVDTGVATPFATPLGIPHYGWFGNDGNFYVPDRGVPGILKIMPDGQVDVLTQDGFFVMPVSCIPTPDDTGWVVSDMGAASIVHVDYAGTQTLLHDAASTGGLVSFPDGIAYDDDGNLYVANLGDNNIVKITPQGVATVFNDDQNLIAQPGGMTIDGAGNLFMASYDLNTVVRFRLDTGVGEVFAGPNSSLMAAPNDIKLSRKGGLLVSGRVGRVSHIDAMGNITVKAQNPHLSELDGVSVKGDDTLCTGRYWTYGSGMAGTGGYMPQFRAIFSPCSGHTIALEFRDFVGGTPALLMFSSGELPQGAATFKQAPLLVDPGAPPFFTIPMFIPGAGAGEGDLTLQFQVPVMGGLDGVTLYHQMFAADPSAPGGVSASNGLGETFGL